MEVVGTAQDGQTALEQLERLRPDITLIDIEMPEIDGLTTTQIINQRFPETKVVILTSHADENYIRQAFRYGAKSYLLKDTPSKEVADAIRFVNKGYLQLGPGLFKKADSEITTVESSSQNNYILPQSTSITTVDSAESNGSSLTKSESSALEDWSPASKDLLDALPRVWTRGLAYFLIIFTVILLPWSMLAKVDETGSARGRLEPKDKTIELDASVRATVAAITVKEGDTVTQGQILVELESDVIRSELEELKEKYSGQLNRLNKLDLVKNQLLLTLNTQKQQNQAQQLAKKAQVEQARQHLDSLKAIYNSQEEEKKAQVEQAKQELNSSKADYKLAEIALKAAREKIPRNRKAFEQGIIPLDRLQEVEQTAKENAERLSQAGFKIEQAESLLRERQSSYDTIVSESRAERQKALLSLEEQEGSYQSLIHQGELALLQTEKQLQEIETQITTLKADIAQSKRQIQSLNFQLKQRVVKSSIDGTVFHLPLSGAGAVVQPGELMVKIAPKKASLVMRGQIATKETGSLKVGQSVKIKLDAYPFQDYGVIPGRLNWVSPDSKTIETNEGKKEVFELEIEPKSLYLQDQNNQIPLTPGQTGTAEIILRQRRVIDLILDPFRKLQKGGLEI
jgi:HlyD family secretion protein